MKKLRRHIFALISVLAMAGFAGAQVITDPPAGGGGATTIASGTTPITGGADTQLCFNDAAFISCGDAGLTYNKTTDFLSVAGGIINGSVSTAGRSILTIRDTISGASATSNFLNVTGKFPATLSAETTALNVAIEVDNDGQVQNAIKASTSGAGGSVDSAVRGSTSHTGTYSIGVLGESLGITTNGAGVLGYSAASASRFGGYFTFSTNIYPVGTSAVLVADNSSVAANIFEARDNGTAVFTIADGGATTTTGVWNWTINSSYFSTNVGLFFGASPNDGVAGIVHKSNQTPDTASLVTPGTSNSWQLTEFNDLNSFDFNNGACGTSACTDPGLIIHSAAQDTTQYNHNAVWGTAGGAIKTLTESAATSVVRIPIANLAGAFGKFCYTVKAADATDSQIRGSCIKYTVTAKAGTETCSLNTEAALTSDASITETEDGSGSGAITTGTLTYAITCDATPANAVDIQINAVSSLTQTTLNVQYNLNHVGPGQPARQ